jgi:hypothetical protein
MTDSTLPRAAWLLGLAGLIPTLAMLIVMLALPDMRAAAATAGLAYGALIVSFVGGSWWGLAVRAEPVEARLLVVSVLPTLTAWPALLVPPATGLLVLSMVFLALLPTDRRLAARGLAPGGWVGIRRPLSLAMAGLHLAAAAVLVSGTPGATLLP